MNVRLHEEYNKNISKNLIKKFNYKNVMETPKLLKIIILTIRTTHHKQTK